MDINSLFLGPKSENEDFFRDMLQFMVNDHIGWRKYFHPDDASLQHLDEDAKREKKETLDRTREALLELAAMMGYDPEKAWGHITSGGTVANY